MDVLLQQHQAKHFCRVPDGLRELCTDISREVLRIQPKDIYGFIADYLEILLITRENAKVALIIVRKIMTDSESIIAVLKKTGLSFKQIAVAAPRLQTTFRDYLDAVNSEREDAGKKVEKESQISIGNILQETGANMEEANRAAILIQTAFRGHYEKMLEREKNGEIQWQRAVMNTMQILKKAGISEREAAKTAPLIKSAYRGYYTRRNIKLQMKEKEDEKNGNNLEPKKTIQAVAWLDMMFEDSDLTLEQANESAKIIQRAFRRFRDRRFSKETQEMMSSVNVEKIKEIETDSEDAESRIYFGDEKKEKREDQEDFEEIYKEKEKINDNEDFENFDNRETEMQFLSTHSKEFEDLSNI